MKPSHFGKLKSRVITVVGSAVVFLTVNVGAALAWDPPLPPL